MTVSKLTQQRCDHRRRIPALRKDRLSPQCFGLRRHSLAIDLVSGGFPRKRGGTPLWVALGAELGNVSGKLFEGRKEKVLRLPEQTGLDELERALDGLIPRAPVSQKQNS